MYIEHVCLRSVKHEIGTRQIVPVYKVKIYIIASKENLFTHYIAVNLRLVCDDIK